MSVVFDPGGGVTSAAGFRAGGTAAGMREAGLDRPALYP